MNFAEAFEAPVVEKIGGKEVTFPVLWNEDYLPWIATESARRRAKSKAMIPPKADPIDQYRMGRMAEFDEPSVDVIANLIWTMPGAMKVLHLSLEKSGMKDEAERKKIINCIPPRRLIQLAVDVSALFEKRPAIASNGQAETTDPNPASAAIPPENESQGT